MSSNGEKQVGKKEMKTLTIHSCFAAVRAADLNCVTSLPKLINSRFYKNSNKKPHIYFLQSVSTANYNLSSPKV